jgi:hypothetical protein
MPFIVATYVYASSQGQRTHSAQTKIAFVPLTYQRYQVRDLLPSIPAIETGTETGSGVLALGLGLGSSCSSQ